MTDAEKNAEVVEAFAELEMKDGFATFEEYYAEELLAFIKARGYGLKWQDWDDIYQDAMICVFEEVTADPNFDFNNLISFAKDIAVKRTVDFVRTKKRKVRWVASEFEDQFIEDMKGSALALHLKITRVEWNEIDATIRAVIDTLTGRQQAAAICFLDVFMEARKKRMSSLSESMSEYLDEHVSLVEAKSAWQEAKEKIRLALKRKGFNPWG